MRRNVSKKKLTGTVPTVTEKVIKLFVLLQRFHYFHPNYSKIGTTYQPTVLNKNCVKSFRINLPHKVEVFSHVKHKFAMKIAMPLKN